MKRLTYDPRVFSELRNEARWYERRVPGLGARLMDLVDHKLIEIAESPELFQRVPGEPRFRRAVLTTYPYSIVFMVKEDVVIIIALAHARRRHAYWRGRGRTVLNENDE